MSESENPTSFNITLEELKKKKSQI